jgi:hypothetical protein
MDSSFGTMVETMLATSEISDFTVFLKQRRRGITKGIQAIRNISVISL